MDESRTGRRAFGGVLVAVFGARGDPTLPALGRGRLAVLPVRAVGGDVATSAAAEAAAAAVPVSLASSLAPQEAQPAPAAARPAQGGWHVLALLNHERLEQQCHQPQRSELHGFPLLQPSPLRRHLRRAERRLHGAFGPLVVYLSELLLGMMFLQQLPALLSAVWACLGCWCQMQARFLVLLFTAPLLL